MLLHEPVERRLTWTPRLVDPATDLHAQPEAGGRGAGDKGGQSSRSVLTVSPPDDRRKSEARTGQGRSRQPSDAAARCVIEDVGLGLGCAELTHRLGHGIGLDGHEWLYMVRGNATRLAAGVTFTDEPGIYVPSELGIRHEDTVVVTGNGCENLGSKWSGTPEEPAVV